MAVAIKTATRDLADDTGTYPRTVTDLELAHAQITNTPAGLRQSKELKRFGTLISCHGYGLVVNRQLITSSCVIDFIIAMLNRKDEPNRTKRIMKLTRASLMLELGMNDENERCTLNQLTLFSDNH